MEIYFITLITVCLYLLPWLGILYVAYYKGLNVISAGAVGLFGTPLLGILYVIVMPVDPVKLKRRFKDADH
ncbi:hypothetical protein [Cobetia marina]|uniref:hypothetical protein n=1 Tax=Cobetia marina TaxID=28258 RepID=UPI00174C56BC